MAANLCADDINGATVAGNPIDIYTCSTTQDRTQQLTFSYDGSLQVMSNCVAVPSGSTGNGIKVVLEPCASGGASGTNEQWQYRPATGAFVNLATGRCLDDTGGSTTNGTQLQIWACNRTDNQLWHLPPASPGAGGNLYTQVMGEWAEPTFVPSSCPAESTYAMWSGIGGYAKNIPLLQNGTDLDPTNGNAPPFSFFEGLGATQATQYPETPVDFPVNSGDDIMMGTLYTPANSASGTPAQVTFGFINLTANTTLQVGPTSTLYGQPVSTFYDGNSAEIIAERSLNTTTGNYYNLRQPTQNFSLFAVGQFGTTKVADEAAHEDPNLQFDQMTSDGTSTGNSLSTVNGWRPDSVGYDYDSWNAAWSACS